MYNCTINDKQKRAPKIYYSSNVTSGECPLRAFRYKVNGNGRYCYNEFNMVFV